MKPAVLVIDDSLTVRMDLEEAFRGAGFETALCGTIEAGRGALSRGIFALVVLDVLLPDGDGVGFLGELRANPATATVPVMLLSTEAEVRDRIRGLTTGADAYVGKPYDRAYVTARARDLARKAPSGSGAATPAAILVIDDSPTFREELRGTLETKGYSVVTAANGEEGLGLAVSLRPRAIIVDGVLPGIDGATVIRRLRQDAALRRTPCVLLTGSEDPAREPMALEAGADAYVRKGDDLTILLARLAAVLRTSDTSVGIEETPSLLGPKKILAVDDSQTYLHALAQLLREEGYEPILARSGEEAIELLTVEPVDCILLDLLMPGLSGNETCERVRASPAWRDIPIVMLTAREDHEAMIESINAGADDYVPKSSDDQVLKARIRAQLRRKQFEDETRRIRERLLQTELEAAEARASRELAETRARLLAELEETNHELEAFAYTVSHDLRAPLRHVSGFIELLEETISQTQESEATRRYAEIIREAATRMGTLIDDLLEFSRNSRAPLNRVPVDLDKLLSEVVEQTETAAAGRRIEWRIGTLPMVDVDSSLMRLVLANLIGNAVKFTRTRDPALIEIAEVAAAEAAEVVVCVRDNGVGFDPRYADKLFGVFQRLHRAEEFEGTGIGLANVRRIVTRHGGRTWAESEPGNGAAFFMALPRATRVS